MIIQKSFKNKNPNLYILASPIGNLKELNQRFIEIIKIEKNILCESMLKMKKILSVLKISCKNKNFTVINKKTENNNFSFLFGKNYILISDAGYPLISDPGYKIVNKFKENNYNLIPINGSSSILSALVTSTFEINEFYFLGFLGKKRTEMINGINKIIKHEITAVFYINSVSLKKLLLVLDEEKIVLTLSIAHELTKINEKIIIGSSKELFINLDKWFINKGEYTIVVKRKKHIQKINKAQLIIKIKKLMEKKYTLKEIILKIKKNYNLSRNYIYKIYIDEKK